MDVVISRYFAHHWQDVGQALREASIDTGWRSHFYRCCAPGHPVLDVYLQTVEILRDTSHVCDYTLGE